uniref:Uncharacterized protein n=1 Tax=Pipistrellus kuhlii TaxID=59472 RepID=A0A7J7WD80_PIPKU|nr:hypothetical protein mPipKuh1_008068 [Pipistrellus kuhlii]
MGTSFSVQTMLISVIVRAFLQSFVLLCGFVFFVVVRFVLIFFFLLCDLRENTFRIISRFYLNVVLRVNFFVLKSLLVGACYWEQVFVQKLQSESLCITETLFIASLLSPHAEDCWIEQNNKYFDLLKVLVNFLGTCHFGLWIS